MSHARSIWQQVPFAVRAVLITLLSVLVLAGVIAARRSATGVASTGGTSMGAKVTRWCIFGLQKALRGNLERVSSTQDAELQGGRWMYTTRYNSAAFFNQQDYNCGYDAQTGEILGVYFTPDGRSGVVNFRPAEN